MTSGFLATQFQWDQLNTTGFTQLESLHIHLSLRYGQATDASVWKSTISFLSQTRSPSISTLVIHLHLVPNSGEDIVQRMKILDWDSFIAQLLVMPTLRLVSFHIVFGLYFTVQDPEPYKPATYDQVRDVILTGVKTGRWTGSTRVSRQDTHWESLDVS